MENKYDEVMGRLGSFELPGHVPVTEEEVGDFERRLGHPLPEGYRTFLLKYGLTSRHGYTLFHAPGDPSKEGGGVGVFYGLNPQDARDLLRKKDGFGDRIPANVLPIADSPGGQICLSLAGADAGKVYWWDRAEDSDDPYENLMRIADDFDAFLGSLTIGQP